jgi:hypothetical protein
VVVVDVVVSLDVVSLDVVPLEVVWLDVVSTDVDSLVAVRDVVVFVLGDVSVVVFVVDGGVTLGGLDSELPPPQCCAFPLPLSLPQLPLDGFPPSPGLPSPFAPLSPLLPVSGFPLSPVPAPEPPLPSESPLDPLPGTSVECVPPGISVEAEGSAMAIAPPRPHRNRPRPTTQADAARCTREPTSPPPFKASQPTGLRSI